MEGRPRTRRTSSIMSSDRESLVDESEAEYIRGMMRKRRETRQARATESMQQVLGHTGAPEFHARLLALRLAVQDYELPMQLAYDELDDLAANTERVKSAIEKDMSLLTVQIRRSNLRYLKSAFLALTFYAQRRISRRAALKNAADYYHRRMLARAFQSWHLFLLRQEKLYRLQFSVMRLLRRHLLARIWRGWKSLVKRRLREDERHWREKQLIRDLNIKQRENVGRRAVNAIRRRVLRRAYFAFKIALEIDKDTKARHDHVFYIIIKRKAAMAFKFWENYPRKKRRDMRISNRGLTKVRRAMFLRWRDWTAYAKYRRRRLNKCRLMISFQKWRIFVSTKARYDTIVARVTRARLRRSFNDFREACLEQKWKARNCQRVKARCEAIRLRWYFEGWISFMQMLLDERALRIEQYVQILENENQKTRYECDRLGRIIDTGEWDQQRLMELEQASHILSGEKEALIKLAARLEGEHKVAMDQQARQEQEIQQLKNEMLGSDFVRRNKLLVKGASSFNSVARAVKSEALKHGVNPEVVSTVDRRCMDQVSVFPDGDLRVKPLSKFDKNKWRRASTKSFKATSESLD